MPTVTQIAEKIGVNVETLRYRLSMPDAPSFKMEPRNHKMTKIYNEQEVVDFWDSLNSGGVR